MGAPITFSSKEKQIWVIKEKKIKAKGNNRKRPSLVQRKNENWKKKRRNKCPVLSGDLKSSTEVLCQLLEETIQTVANGGLTSGWTRREKTWAFSVKGCADSWGEMGSPIKRPSGKWKTSPGKERIVYLAKQEDEIAGFKPRLIRTVIFPEKDYTEKSLNIDIQLSVGYYSYIIPY